MLPIRCLSIFSKSFRNILQRCRTIRMHNYSRPRSVLDARPTDFFLIICARIFCPILMGQRQHVNRKLQTNRRPGVSLSRVCWDLVFLAYQQSADSRRFTLVLGYRICKLQTESAISFLGKFLTARLRLQSGRLQAQNGRDLPGGRRGWGGAVASSEILGDIGFRGAPCRQ